MSKQKGTKKSRVEFLRTKYLPLIKESKYLKQELNSKIKNEEDLFNEFLESDPTSNKKFLLWMLERFLKAPKMEDGSEGKRLIVEDLYKTIEFLEFFDRFNDKFDESDRNIADVKSIDDFYDLVESKMPKEGEFISQTQMDKKFKGEADIWVDNERWKVVVPKTFGASCAYGKNTRWCTATEKYDSHFHSHHKSGPLIILIDKKADVDEQQFHKYQFHFETNQFMDAQDKRVNETYLDIISSDKDVLNAFLENLKSKYSFLIRIKLDLPIPEDQKVISDEEGKTFELDLKDMKAANLPEGLEIKGSLNITGNKNIKHIKNLKVHGDLKLNNSTIETIENVYVGDSFEARDCENLSFISENTIVENGSLDLSNCKNLESLPSNSEIRRGNVFATNCESLKNLPETLKVKYGVYIRHTQLAKDLISGKEELKIYKNICKGDNKDLFYD